MKAVTRTRLIFAVFDFLLVILGALFVAYLHDGISMRQRNLSYQIALIILPFFWLLLSTWTRKFRVGERSNQTEVLFSVLYSNFLILSATTILLVLFGMTYFSRFILFGTFLIITIVEVIAGFIYVSLQKSLFLQDWMGMEISSARAGKFVPLGTLGDGSSSPGYRKLRESIVEESGDLVFDWVAGQVDLTGEKSLVTSIDSRFNLISNPEEYYHSVVNFHRINDLRRINKFFETVNAKLVQEGIYIGCSETYHLRKQRILAKFFPGVNYLIYGIDFLIHRVLPKLTITNKLYFLVTGGKRRVISRTETLGRLYSCGFEVLEERTIGDLLYWKARKIRKPYFDANPTYGIFIHLKRIGKDGREFKVYKLRTMHSYAEYLQAYVYDANNLDEGGKFKDDFRVSGLGKFLRRFWLDELPMLFNLLKGDMKLVGVRPLSRHYFSLYTEELQQMRTRFKPGLIPPYYAWNPTPKTLEDVQENEMEYLRKCELHPYWTDFAYFFRAMHNIVWRRARSQ